MPQGQPNQATVPNIQGIPAPQLIATGATPGKYLKMRWEGKKILTLPCTPSIEKIQNLRISNVETVFPQNSLASDWTRMPPMVFNNHKLRGDVVRNFLTSIAQLLNHEIEIAAAQPEGFKIKEDIKKFIEEFFTGIQSQNFTALENKLALLDNENFKKTQQDIKKLKNLFSSEEINTLLDNYKQELICTIDNPPPTEDSSLNKWSPLKSQTNPNSVQRILNRFHTIADHAINPCLTQFFIVEIEKSNIHNGHDGLKKSLIALMNQNGIGFLAQNIFISFFDSQACQPGTIDTENSQITAFYDKEKNQLFIEASLRIFSVVHSSKTKCLPKGKKQQRKLSSTEIGEFPDINQCEPLFILNIQQTLSPIDSDDAEFKILRNEVLVADNEELISMWGEIGLAPFELIMQQLVNADGTNGESINYFINSWLKFYNDVLPQKTRVRLQRKATDRISYQEILDTLEEIVNSYRSTKPLELVACNEKLKIIIPEYEKFYPDSKKLHVLSELQRMTEKTLQGKSYPVAEEFRENFIKRTENFIDIQNLLFSILKKLEKYNESSLYFDFISLGLAIEKMGTSLTFKDFGNFAQFDMKTKVTLEAWKFAAHDINQSQSTLDKEMAKYFQKGIWDFEKLVSVPNEAIHSSIKDQSIQIKENLKQITSPKPEQKLSDEAKKQFETETIASLRAEAITHQLKNKITSATTIKDSSCETVLNKYENFLNTQSIEEFKKGASLKEVATADVGRLADKAVTLTSNIASNKTFLEKYQACETFRKDSFWITQKPILRTAVTIAASAVAGFIVGAAVFTLVVAATGGAGAVPAVVLAMLTGFKTAKLATAVATTFTAIGAGAGAMSGGLAGNPSSFFSINSIKNFFKFRKPINEVTETVAAEFHPPASAANP